MNLANLRFTGSFVALVTPMHSNGEIDYVSFKSLIDWQIACGTHGLVIMGTTGESPLVSVDEHVEVIKVAIEHVKGRVPVIAGCGSASTQHVVELVTKLNPLNPDAYLCVVPYYIKPSQSGLIAHFQTIADVCQSPLFLYNVPSRTACDLADESVVELAKHNNIIGIKDATGDLKRAEKLFSQLGESFIFLSGDDATAYEYVTKGGNGVISVTANIAPKAMSLWCESLLKPVVVDDEVEQGKLLFGQLKLLHDKLFIEANPIPVKWSLAFMDKIPLGIRLPLTQPSAESQSIIKDVLSSTSELCNLE